MTINYHFYGKLKILKSKVLSISCGDQSLLANEILKELQLETRIVASITLEEWNEGDDGHTLIEVRDENGIWSAYDTSFLRYFRLFNC